MAYINAITSFKPEYEMPQSEMNQVADRWLANDPLAHDKFVSICKHSGVDKRRFIKPYPWILSQNGLKNRALEFRDSGGKALQFLIGDVLKKSKNTAREIDSLIFSSCSVPLIPSIDASVLTKCGIKDTVSRLPIYQHGCGGGVIGLALGNKLAKSGGPVLVSSVEFCSLVFHPTYHQGAHLVGAAIFADGGGAAIITKEEGTLELLATQSYLIPNSEHLMGYDVFDDGFHLKLDQSLPSLLIQYAPQIIRDFLAQQELTTDKLDYWLFHPGGIKILKFLEDAFGLKAEQCHFARDVLKENGNVSSATIFYVIEHFLNSAKLKKNQLGLIVGIGPGLTIETILFRTCRSN